MRKIIVCIMCVCIVLAGCGKEENALRQKGIAKNASGKITEINSIKNESKNRDIKDKKILRLFADGKKLTLMDLVNNKNVNKYQLNKNQCVNSIINLTNGYCVQFYKANRELKNQVIQGISVEDIPNESEIVNVSIRFFDKNLHETDVVDVSKLAKEIKNEDLLMSNFIVSPDGTQIAWNIGDNILCYNRKINKFTKYNQITKRDIIVENIIFVGNNKLAFYGSNGQSEEDTIYGYFNLEDRKVYSFVEKKYEAFSLSADTRYVWLNDGESPNDGTASGKMPIIDTETGKKQIVTLDNIESTKARITEDGKYIIAVNQKKEKSFRVRQYDVKRGKVLNEKKYDFNGLVHASDIIPIDDEKLYGIIYSTNKEEKVEKFELK